MTTIVDLILLQGERNLMYIFQFKQKKIFQIHPEVLISMSIR